MKLSSFRPARPLVATLAVASCAVLGASKATAAFIDTNQVISVVAAGSYYQELFYNYTTAAVSVSGVFNFDSDVPYILPTEQWIGIFHYDYAAARFTEAVYEFEDTL